MADTTESDTKKRMFALRAAQWVGCSGAHQHNGEWMPCETHEELLRRSGKAEPTKKKTAFEELQERTKKRKRKGKRKDWENLQERKPLGFATMENGGIVSAPIVAFPNVALGKSYIPGVSPRDNDPDVFTDIESARKRSRMLGCIGVRRMPSATGRTVWMPCTNNTDYSRLAGTTFLGRRRQEEARNNAIRTIVRREIQSQTRKRTKSLFDELHGEKGLGRVIGNALRPGSAARRARRAMVAIEGELDPKVRRDKDGDGFIFDGTWREMPDPTLATSALRSTRISADDESWASPVRNNWLTPNRVKKGGKIKASELLNYDRVRLRKNRDEQARVLGVSRQVLDAMYEPDASLDPYDADRLVTEGLGLHPVLIWGDAWLEPDLEEAVRNPRITVTGEVDKRSLQPKRKLNERDKQILELRASGATQQEIADQFGISRRRAGQLIAEALKRNEAEIDDEPGTTLRSMSGDGMIRRDEKGKPIRQADKRKEVLDASIKKMKELGLTDEEINFLMTGDRNTPVDTQTRDVDIAKGFRTTSASLRSSRFSNIPPSEWPQSTKRTIVDWANGRPSFNVPYSLAQKYKQNGDLSDREWRTLLRFFEQYGPGGSSRPSVRSSRVPGAPVITNQYENVGARRMVKIILDRVKQDKRNRSTAQKTHYQIIGPGAMGKSTLLEYLIQRGDIPKNDEAAHVDADFIKLGIEGYNGGVGSEAVHRTSAHASTDAINQAADLGMDVVSEGTGLRMYEYKTVRDNTYRKVVHIPYTPYDTAIKRLRERNAKGGRQLRESQIREKGSQLYSFVTDQLRRGNIQNLYIWDMDVPEGAAPRVIAKIEDGVFVAIDEPKFKAWTEQHGGRRGGDSNIDWFRRNFPTK